MSAEQRTVTVIGLGLIGSALVRAFTSAGHAVTVWNRTPAKAAPFQDRVRLATSVAEACAASATIVVAVLNYQVSSVLLRTAAVEAVIAGKTLVQVMTGTAADARDAEQWATQHGLAYLDGVIGGGSGSIGTESTTISCSGAATVFEQQRGLLSALGKPTFCGEAIGTAATLNMALLGLGYALSSALLQGAALCAAESVSLEDFFAASNLPAWLLDECTRDGPVAERPPITAALAAQAMTRPRRYREAGLSSMNTYTACLEDMVRASHEAGIESAVLEALLTCYRKALALGHGRHDLPALYEAFAHE